MRMCDPRLRDNEAIGPCEGLTIMVQSAASESYCAGRRSSKRGRPSSRMSSQDAE